MTRTIKQFLKRFVMIARYHWNARRCKFKIMTPQKTIRYIKKNRCSIARFGDGEFNLILNRNHNLKFQENNCELATRLEEVLANEDENVLVCIPYSFSSLKGRTDASIDFWQSWAKRDNKLERIAEIINLHHRRRYVFGDSQITRPYIAYRTQRNAIRIFSILKDLWEEKDIIIIEGENTRFGVGNDLLLGAKSVKRILAPSTNAFEKMEEIEKELLRIYQGELVIMALGPTATVLAVDLARKNIQALDIGHFDIEYEWFKKGVKTPEAVQNKFTNEAENGDSVAPCSDKKYLKQIIARIQ